MAHQIVTIGDLDVSPEAMATSEVFAGAQNRTAIAGYMGALAWEKFSKGLAIGAVAGVVVTLGAMLYLQPYAAPKGRR